MALSLAETSLTRGVVAALVTVGVYRRRHGYVIGRTGVNSLVLTVCMLIALPRPALIMTPKTPGDPAGRSLLRVGRAVAPWGPLTLLEQGLVIVRRWLADAQQQAGAPMCRRRAQCRARKRFRRVDHAGLYGGLSPASGASRAIAAFSTRCAPGSASGMLDSSAHRRLRSSGWRERRHQQHR